MTLQQLKEFLQAFIPTAIAVWNYFKSAKKSDLREVRRRLSVLERAFADMFSLTQEFLDELDLLVDGLPHGLRPTFRAHITIFRTTLNKMRDRLHDEHDATGEEK